MNYTIKSRSKLHVRTVRVSTKHLEYGFHTYKMIIYWWDLCPSRILHSITGCLLHNVLRLCNSLILKGPFTIKDETPTPSWNTGQWMSSDRSQYPGRTEFPIALLWKPKNSQHFFLIIESGFSCSSKVVLDLQAGAHDLRPNFILCLFDKDRNKIQGSYGQLLWSLMLNTKIPFVKTLHSTPAN